MAGEMAGWCGPDRYVDAQGRVHVAVVDVKGELSCVQCSLKICSLECESASCVGFWRADGKDVHFELQAVRGPQGTEGGGE